MRFRLPSGPILGLSTFVGFAWSHWIRSATIDDLRSFNRLAVGSGEWIAVEGFSDWRMDYLPKFLLNVNDGQSLSIGPALTWNWDELEFSADGSRAVWVTFSTIDQWPLMYAGPWGVRPKTDVHRCSAQQGLG